MLLALHSVYPGIVHCTEILTYNYKVKNTLPQVLSTYVATYVLTRSRISQNKNAMKKAYNCYPQVNISEYSLGSLCKLTSTFSY